MHHALLAGALSLLAVSTAPASSPIPQASSPTPAVEQAAPAVSMLPAIQVAQQIETRVEQYQQQVKLLTDRSLATSAEQRPAIQRQMEDASLQLRLDIFGYQLEYAQSVGNTELAKKIETNIARLIEVSKNPQTVLRAEKAVRDTPAVPSNAKAAPTGSSKSRFGKQGGDR